MPVCLLLLLILILLLEDAGAQQGEWFPGGEWRAGRRGCGVSGPAAEAADTPGGQGGAVRFVAWPDLAQHFVG